MNEPEQAELRKLLHDIRSPFSIICMGVDALKALRDDEQQFNAICATIEQEGIERLREKLDALPDAIAKMTQPRG